MTQGARGAGAPLCNQRAGEVLAQPFALVQRRGSPARRDVVEVGRGALAREAQRHPLVLALALEADLAGDAMTRQSSLQELPKVVPSLRVHPPSDRPRARIR